MIRKLMVSAFVLALMALPLRGAEKISTPVEVEANEMEIIDADKQAIFRGKVHAVRGSQNIRSDVMTVFYADVKQPDGTSKSQASKLDAKGNVDHHHEEAGDYRRMGENGHSGEHPAGWRQGKAHRGKNHAAGRKTHR